MTGRGLATRVLTYIILDSMLYTAHGLLDSQMRETHPDKKFKQIKGTNTNTYIEQFFESCND